MVHCTHGQMWTYCMWLEEREEEAGCQWNKSESGEHSLSNHVVGCFGERKRETETDYWKKRRSWMDGQTNHYMGSIRQKLIGKAWGAGNGYKQDISRKRLKAYSRQSTISLKTRPNYIWGSLTIPVDQFATNRLYFPQSSETSSENLPAAHIRTCHPAKRPSPAIIIHVICITASDVVEARHG